jgi:hypothetical protein
MGNIYYYIKTYFNLLIRGEWKKVKIEIEHKFTHLKNDYRVKNFFLPISLLLTKKQKDYRLIVYKNFNYKHSKFREIFKKLNSNKGGEWDSRNGIIRSYYAEFYEEELKEKKINNLLEIGIGFKHSFPGASLRAWGEIFPSARIYGADNNREVLFNEKNIKTFYTDQLNINELENLKKILNNVVFDVIIDDGLHTFEANVNTFNVFKNSLSKSGLYFIEDVKYHELKKYYKYFINLKNYDFKIIECLNTEESYANAMIIIKKEE